MSTAGAAGRVSSRFQERLDVENRAAEGGDPETTVEVLEKSVDFPAQRFEGPPGLDRRGLLRSLSLCLHRYFACTLSHDQILLSAGIAVTIRQARKMCIAENQIQGGLRPAGLRASNGLIACQLSVSILGPPTRLRLSCAAGGLSSSERRRHRTGRLRHFRAMWR